MQRPKVAAERLGQVGVSDAAGFAQCFQLYGRKRMRKLWHEDFKNVGPDQGVCGRHES